VDPLFPLIFHRTIYTRRERRIKQKNEVGKKEKKERMEVEEKAGRESGLKGKT